MTRAGPAVEHTVSTARSSAPAPEATGRLKGLRFVFVLRWHELGGAERHALLCARRLVSAEGATVEVRAITHGEGSATRGFREAGIEWRNVPIDWGGGRIGNAARLAKVGHELRRARPDVLVSYCTLPNTLCGLLWRATGASLHVWSQHDVLPPGKVGYELMGRAARNASVLISNSAHGSEFLVRELSVARERVTTVYGGVALPPIHADRSVWRGRLGVGDDDFLCLMIARLQAQKDHATLLRAWRRIVDRNRSKRPDSVLLLAGLDAGMEDALKALAFDLELGRSVRFLGEVTDISGLVGAVDLGVFSSVSEGCPNGVLECMAGGLAIAGTDIPGIREAVGVEGIPFLAPVADPDILADAILRLAGGPELRKRIGAGNAERVRTMFDAERNLMEHAAVIVKHLERSRLKPRARRPGFSRSLPWPCP